MGLVSFSKAADMLNVSKAAVLCDASLYQPGAGWGCGVNRATLGYSRGKASHDAFKHGNPAK
jgi:hypothetical protein